MSEPRVLLAGVGLGESPRWRAGRLWFADWLAGEIVAVDPAGTRRVMADVASLPLSFDWRPDGTLLVVSGGDGLLLRGDQYGRLATHVDLKQLMDPPWNEIVVDRRGNAYLNCTGFDFPGGEFAPGIIALVTPDGELRRVADDVAFPNGMVVTPDGTTLILAESYGNKLTAFDIADDGGLSGRRTWAHLGHGAPDGICLDADGAVWYADVPNARCVRVREGGKVLQTVELDRGCFACMLGGEDGRTLFVVAADWRGSVERGGAPTGQVLAIEAPAAAAGRL